MKRLKMIYCLFILITGSLFLLGCGQTEALTATEYQIPPAPTLVLTLEEKANEGVHRYQSSLILDECGLLTFGAIGTEDVSIAFSEDGDEVTIMGETYLKRRKNTYERKEEISGRQALEIVEFTGDEFILTIRLDQDRSKPELCVGETQIKFVLEAIGPTVVKGVEVPPTVFMEVGRDGVPLPPNYRPTVTPTPGVVVKKEFLTDEERANEGQHTYNLTNVECAGRVVYPETVTFTFEFSENAVKRIDSQGHAVSWDKNRENEYVDVREVRSTDAQKSDERFLPTFSLIFTEDGYREKRQIAQDLCFVVIATRVE